jgi:two-component system sensor histidine kinase KdpD
VIQVADRGSGIQEDELQRIFDSFYRGKLQADCSSIPPKKGSGLGLAVCKGFVEAHGGTIWAENRVGGGAVFQFTLPR